MGSPRCKGGACLFEGCIHAAIGVPLPPHILKQLKPVAYEWGVDLSMPLSEQVDSVVGEPEESTLAPNETNWRRRLVGLAHEEFNAAKMNAVSKSVPMTRQEVAQLEVMSQNLETSSRQERMEQANIRRLQAKSSNPAGKQRQESPACDGGRCVFVDSFAPECGGGLCVFERCFFPTCNGGGCEFKQSRTILAQGFCDGGGCTARGAPLTSTKARKQPAM